MLKVIHVSCTPLAGAPIRLVNALNKYNICDSRLINLNPKSYGDRTFPEDLIWEADKELCINLLENADIIHLHHYFDISSVNNPFEINFKKIAKKRCKFVRHFHSAPSLLQSQSGVASEDIVNDLSVPQIVIPHYPERYYPNARVVPNIIPINDYLYKPISRENKIVQVCFSPSNLGSMWDSRWNTKGAPEVIKELKKEITKNKYAEFKIIRNTPFLECMKLKQNSSISIDDIVTGSYHLSGLESLSQGIPTLAYLDGRSESILKEMSGSNLLPFVNTHLFTASSILNELINDKTLRSDISKFSRSWMEKYYDDAKLIKIYENMYNDLLNNSDDFLQNSVVSKTNERVNLWISVKLHDLKWDELKRKNYNHSMLYFSDLFVLKLKNLFSKIKLYIKKHLQ